ncbi:MAG: hypothetical protein MI919_09070 [Holophagales bacterium]|nr:hypothetical protein [Holophagales bacterium]
MPHPPYLPALLLAGATLPLLAGPLLARWADRSEGAKAAMDAFAAVSLGGIVVLHIWPHAFLTAGAWTVVGGLLGLLLPFLLHGTLHARERDIYPGFVLLAFFGLAVHATLDGVALFGPLLGESGVATHSHGGEDPVGEGLGAAGHDGPGDSGDVGHGDDGHELGGRGAHGEGAALLLALAVILHRLPMGLAVWWFAVPIFGRRTALGLLVLIAGSTFLGFSFAGRLLVEISMPGIAIFEATIAGMLLHVVMGHEHGHAEPAAVRSSTASSALGTLAGLFLVVGLFAVHPLESLSDSELSFGDTFLTLGLGLAPVLLAAVALASGASAFGRSAEGAGGGGAGKSGAGKSGAGMSALRAWRAVPAAARLELSLPALAVSWWLLGPAWTAVRATVTAAALGVMMLSDRAAGKDRSAEPALSSGRGAVPGAKRPGEGLGGLLEAGLHSTLVWAVLGVGLVALLEPMVPAEAAAPHERLDLLAAGLLAFAVYRNALFGSILAFFLLHKGWSAEAVAAFLLVGSVAALLGAMERESRKVEKGMRLKNVALLSSIFLGVAVLDRLGPSAVWDLHGEAAAGTGPLGLPAALVCLFALGVSLFRRGFRGFLRPIFRPAEAMTLGGADADRHGPDHDGPGPCHGGHHHPDPAGPSP